MSGVPHAWNPYTGLISPLPRRPVPSRRLRYVDPVGVEIRGWLRAKEASRYELATDLTASLDRAS